MSAWSRRDVLKGISAPAIAASLPLPRVEAAPPFSSMPAEGLGTPKICLGYYGAVDPSGMQRVLRRDDRELTEHEGVVSRGRRRSPGAAAPAGTEGERGDDSDDCCDERASSHGHHRSD